MSNFLQDDSGNNSSVRLSFLVTLAVLLAVWTFTCYQKHELVEIPTTMLGLVSVLMGGKVISKQIENSSTNSKE